MGFWELQYHRYSDGFYWALDYKPKGILMTIGSVLWCAVGDEVVQPWPWGGVESI